MHPIQEDLNRVVDPGVPGAFASLEAPDGTPPFYTAGWADLATKRRLTTDFHWPNGQSSLTPKMEDPHSQHGRTLGQARTLLDQLRHTRKEREGLR